MLCGIKYCGGCNPRYERSKALVAIKEYFDDKIQFIIAEEGKEYDFILVIGGCTNCCAAFDKYKSKNGYIRMWDYAHLERTIKEIEDMGGNEF